jgi:hypothetical protein
VGFQEHFIMVCAKISDVLAPVAHACNPSFSGGRDQEDRISKPAWANSLQDPILKNLLSLKIGLVE